MFQRKQKVFVDELKEYSYSKFLKVSSNPKKGFWVPVEKLVDLITILKECLSCTDKTRRKITESIIKFIENENAWITFSDIAIMHKNVHAAD